ncbi:MAG: Hsp20/alpha crystallin family protein [Syntrophales bacterium LBB04]|nr:Hsp20/alpha crystallin family protein [Syntrophales bacterium LBB04]
MFWPEISRYGRITDPLNEMRRLQREVNRLFSGVGQATSYDFPPINVWLSENDAVLTAELPGVDPAKLDISITGDSLSLGGVHEAEKAGQEKNYHRQERSFGSFRRSIKLPFQVETDKVEAVYEKGLLQLTLPRAEAEKPRKIAIKSE